MRRQIASRTHPCPCCYLSLLHATVSRFIDVLTFSAQTEHLVRDAVVHVLSCSLLSCGVASVSWRNTRAKDGRQTGVLPPCGTALGLLCLVCAAVVLVVEWRRVMPRNRCHLCQGPQCPCAHLCVPWCPRFRSSFLSLCSLI